MASTSSRSNPRIRDKDKAVRGVGGGRDIAEGLSQPSRISRRSNPPRSELLSTTVNISGHIHFNQCTIIGRPPEEESEQLCRPRATANAYRETAPQVQRRNRIIRNEDEEGEEESDAFESDQNYSCEDEPLQLPSRVARSTKRVQTWQDSGYSDSTRGSRREKDEAYRGTVNKRSLDRPLVEEGSWRAKRKTKPPSAASNAEEGTASEADETHLAIQGDDGRNSSDDSDNDFARRHMEVATIDSKPVPVSVILDTGTKPNWISSRFLKDLRLKSTKLSDKENKKEFTDFNGNKFKGIGKVNVMVTSTDFSGISCRNLPFFVCKKDTFPILLGRITIEKENLLCKPPDPERESALPAVQAELKNAERTAIAQNKEKQKKEGAERDKMREEKRKDRTKERKESSSSSAARFAQESKPRQRREKPTSPSPSKNVTYPVTKSTKSSWKQTKAPLKERSSSSSLSGGGAAIND